MRLRRLAALLLLGCLPGACGPSQQLADALPERPNLVVVIGDDHGWPDFGFMGHATVRTPNLDRLAAEGVLFPHAFNTGSSCRPSLLGLLTGLHPVEIRARRGRHGADPRLPPAIVQHFDTLPRLLTEHGYVAFQGGKHWEGHYADAGFTHGMTTDGGSGGRDRAGGAGLALGRRTMEPLWEFLEAHREQPFLVWFAPMLPHQPFDAPAEFAAPYGDAGHAAPYFANVTRFDAVVGQLLDRLDALDLTRRTLVVYLADNGWDVLSPPEPGTYLMIGGARGKSSAYELGFRTPLVFRWPGVLPAGLRDERLVSTVDLLPTLLEVAGLEAPAARRGHSLVPALRGRGGVVREQVAGGMLQLRNDDERRDPGARTFRNEQAWFLRTPEWRYVWFPDAGAERLYRIDEDPLERADLAEREPEQARRLRERLVAWLDEARTPPQSR